MKGSSKSSAYGALGTLYTSMILPLLLKLGSKQHVIDLDTSQCVLAGVGLPVLAFIVLFVLLPQYMAGGVSREALNKKLSQALPLATALLEGEVETGGLIKQLSNLAQTEPEAPDDSWKAEVAADDSRKAEVVKRMALYGMGNVDLIAHALHIPQETLEGWMLDPEFQSKVDSERKIINGALSRHDA